ncbi:MAG: hypothetical protein ABL916_24695 [Burkholderiaceae bacterium]
MARVPSYAKTTALVSRALKLTPETLEASFVPATRDDLSQVVEMRRQVIGAGLAWDDPPYLSWRYHFGSEDQGRGECWVVKRDSSILAMVGSERISVQYQGHVVDGLTVMDIAVRPDLEGVGLGVWMAMRLGELFDCVLAIGSNANSRRIVSNVFVRLPDRRVLSHILEFEDILVRKLGPRARWLTKLISGAARQGMKFWRWGIKLTRDRSIRIEPLLRFDESIKDLISRSQVRDEVVIGRNEQFLNWRLFDNPRSTYSVWAAFSGKSMAGYIALRTSHREDGDTSLVIVDILAPAGLEGLAVLKVLLCHAFDQATAHGCHRIAVVASHRDTERVLARLGFLKHRSAIKTLSVLCRDVLLNEAISMGSPWHITAANTDQDE